MTNCFKIWKCFCFFWWSHELRWTTAWKFGSKWSWFFCDACLVFISFRVACCSLLFTGCW